jgi:hypothetical protein
MHILSWALLILQMTITIWIALLALILIFGFPDANRNYWFIKRLTLFFCPKRGDLFYSVGRESAQSYALLKVMLKKIPTRRLVFSFLVGPPGLALGTKGFRFV